MKRSLIIDRVMRVYVNDIRSGMVRFILDNPKDVSMHLSMDGIDVVDARQVPITRIDRSKMFEVSASNAMFNADLLSEQYGDDIKQSDAVTTFTAPCSEEIAYDTGSTDVVLSHTPTDGVNGAPTIRHIYLLHDGAIAKTYDYAIEADSTSFTYDGRVITLPIGLSNEDGGTVLVVYDYEANDDDVVLKIEDGVNKTNGLRKVLLEVLFRDTCNPKSRLFGWIEIPRCRFSGEFDKKLDADSDHPFTIRAVRAFCVSNQPLCTVYIEDESDDSEMERDYNEYFNKPSINWVVLRGDKSLEDYRITVPYPLSLSEIDAAIGW